MQIAELHVDGIRGFPDRGRLVLGPGHVVLPAGASLLPVMRALFFFDGDPADGASDLASRPDAVVAALLRGRDGSSWRIERMLHRGARLHRWNEEVRRWDEVTAVAAEIGTLLRGQIGLPSERALLELFSLDGARLASIAAGAEAAAPEAPAPLPAPALDPLPASLPAASMPAAPAAPGSEGRIADLEAELQAAEKVEILQRQLDEAMHDLATAERAAEEVGAARRQVERCNAEMARFQALEELPDDLGSHVAAWREAQSRLDGELDRIEADRQALAARVGAGAPAPLWRDLRFVAGLVVGVAAIVAALLTPLRILALLNVPAFGVAAALAVRWIGARQVVESAGRLGGLLDERARRAHAGWEKATASMREAMALAQVDTQEALLERVDERRAAAAALAQAQAALQQAESAHAPTLARVESLRARVADLERELAACSAGAWRPRELVERELAAARAQRDGTAPAEQVSTPRPAPSPAQPPGFAVDPLPGFRDVRPVAPGSIVVEEKAAPTRDPAVRILEHAAEIVGLPPQDLAARVEQRAGALLAGMTGGRWAALAISPTGGLRCTGRLGLVPFGALAEEDRALAWIALQLALVEAATTRQPVPVLLDDPLARLDEAARPQVMRLLQALGGRTQVIHRTELPLAQAHAHAVVAA